MEIKASGTTSKSNEDVKGAATETGIGGTVPYTCTWSNSTANGADVNDLTARTYTVSMTDTNGCTETEIIFVGHLIS